MEMVFSDLKPHRGTPIAAVGTDSAYQRLRQLDWQNLRLRLAAAGELVRALRAGRVDRFAGKCASFHQSAARIIAAHQPEDVPVNQMCSTIGKSLGRKPSAAAGEGSTLKVDPVESSLFE